MRYNQTSPRPRAAPDDVSTQELIRRGGLLEGQDAAAEGPANGALAEQCQTLLGEIGELLAELRQELDALIAQDGATAEDLEQARREGNNGAASMLEYQAANIAAQIEAAQTDIEALEEEQAKLEEIIGRA